MSDFFEEHPYHSDVQIIDNHADLHSLSSAYWGTSTALLTAEHLEALQNGKALCLLEGDTIMVLFGEAVKLKSYSSQDD